MMVSSPIVMTLPSREEYLKKTLAWLESPGDACPVCIRQINLIREELALIRSRMTDKAIGEGVR
jgi:hypothetical protein